MGGFVVRDVAICFGGDVEPIRRGEIRLVTVPLEAGLRFGDVCLRRESNRGGGEGTVEPVAGGPERTGGPAASMAKWP